MKRSVGIFSAVSMFLLAAVSLQAGDVIFIKDGTIVPVVGEVIQNGGLLIEGGKIVKIGDGIQAPPDAQVIDASGKYVYPGMIALMTGVGVTGYPGAGDDMDEIGVSTPHMDPFDAINPEDDTIEVTRIEGVTTVMTMSGSRSVINGKSVVLNLEGDLAEDLILDRYVAQIINMGAKIQGKYPSTLPGVVSVIREKLSEAKKYAEEKGDRESEPENRWDRRRRESVKYKMEMEALRPVIERKVPVVLITRDEVTVRNALKIIKEYNLRGIIQASKGILKYADLIAQKKIPVIWAGTTSVPERWEPFDLNYHTAAVLAEKGVLFAFAEGGRGPGSRNVRNLPVPASISMAYGLSEEDAVKAITINPAKILGMEDTIGSLEEGKAANVVIWSGSPIQMKSRVHTVIINGKLIPRTSIQTRLYDKFKKIIEERTARKKKS